MLRTHALRRAQGGGLFLLLGVLCVPWVCAESSRGSSGPESRAPAGPAPREAKDGGPTKQVQQQSGEKPAGPVQRPGGQEPAKPAVQLGPLDRELFNAVIRSDVEAVSASIAKGANVNARDQIGHTPLHWAVEEHRRAAAEVLIAKGADLNALNIADGTPLHTALRVNDIELARLLISSGANLTIPGAERKTPLRAAIDEGDTEIVGLLLEAGAPLDIYTAAALGKIDYLKAALARDPSTVNRVDESWYGVTALHKAARHGQKEAVELLLSHGADVNAKTRGGTTPLHQAVSGGHREVVQMLLDHGANVNAGREILDDTPLHIAARRGDVVVAKILLEHGADVKARNSDGIWWFGMIRPRPGSGPTPFGVAVKEGHKEVADLLREHGAAR